MILPFKFLVNACMAVSSSGSGVTGFPRGGSANERVPIEVKAILKAIKNVRTAGLLSDILIVVIFSPKHLKLFKSRLKIGKRGQKVVTETKLNSRLKK